jgi:hypothetical protein
MKRRGEEGSVRPVHLREAYQKLLSRIPGHMKSPLMQ